MYKSYVAVAPRPQDFPKLLDRMGDFMRTPFDFEEDVKNIHAQTLLVFGDADMIHLDHVVKFYQLLGGGREDAGFMREHMPKNRLAILPNVTHYETFHVASDGRGGLGVRQRRDQPAIVGPSRRRAGVASDEPEVLR